MLAAFSVPSVSIEDIKWTPGGLSVQTKVENFDQQNVKIQYECRGDQVDAGSGITVGNQFHKFSNLPHVLKIKWQETLKYIRVTARDDHGNTATCEAEIPRTPGKMDTQCVLQS